MTQALVVTCSQLAANVVLDSYWQAKRDQVSWLRRTCKSNAGIGCLARQGESPLKWSSRVVASQRPRAPPSSPLSDGRMVLLPSDFALESSTKDLLHALQGPEPAALHVTTG
jgi:hypothetical protein